MEPADWLSGSQEPATDPYPESDESIYFPQQTKEIIMPASRCLFLILKQVYA
jgi:hypothetical protein